tara:strand:- start:682 stop:1320 length:639 start_codon:yes stop_codon:yes gene_type:complete
MPKKLDAIFNPSEQWRPVEEGEYPAHVSKLTVKEGVNTRAGEAIIVNMEYLMAPEVSDCYQEVFEMDGYDYCTDGDGERIHVLDGDGSPSSVTCSHLKGRTYKDNGFFVFLNSESGSKNSRYFDLLDGLGIKCDTDKIDGKEVKKLVLIEEEDVVGKPVYVSLKREQYVTAATKHLPPHEQETRSTFKVKTVKTWEGGESITPSEIEDEVPF